MGLRFDNESVGEKKNNREKKFVKSTGVDTLVSLYCLIDGSIEETMRFVYVDELFNCLMVRFFE